MQNMLVSQKTNLREYIDKIESLEEEMKKVEKLFTESQQTLDKTTQRLNRTTQERDETKELVAKHLETEEELFGQANNLLQTVEETVTHTKSLHSSLQRNKQVQISNIESSNTFKKNAQEELSSISKNLSAGSKLHGTFKENIKEEIGKFYILFFFSSILIKQGIFCLIFSFEYQRQCPFLKTWKKLLIYKCLNAKNV